MSRWKCVDLGENGVGWFLAECVHTFYTSGAKVRRTNSSSGMCAATTKAWLQSKITYATKDCSSRSCSRRPHSSGPRRITETDQATGSPCELFI